MFLAELTSYRLARLINEDTRCSICSGSGKNLAALRLSPLDMAIPQYTAAWILKHQIGVEGLSFVEHSPLPRLQEDEVLVGMHAASLNARELVVAQVHHYTGLATPSS